MTVLERGILIAACLCVFFLVLVIQRIDRKVTTISRWLQEYNAKLDFGMNCLQATTSSTASSLRRLDPVRTNFSEPIEGITGEVVKEQTNEDSSS